MVYMLVRHKVKDYAVWKSVFDQHADLREKYGCLGGSIFRNTDNPDEVVVFLEWNDLKGIHEFLDLDVHNDVMQRAGVVDQPDGYFLDLVEKVDS